MAHKLTILGMAVAAVLAMSAVTASAASAAEFFHSEIENTTIKGEQTGENVLTTNAGTVKCKQWTDSGSQAAKTVESVELQPSTSECTAFSFVGSTIDWNGCKFKPTLNFASPIDLICPIGNSIVITAFPCWVVIGPQTLGGNITYINTNSGSTRDIDESVSLTSIVYRQISKSFPGCTNGTFSNGTYTGSSTRRGFTSGGTQVGIWKE